MLRSVYVYVQQKAERKNRHLTGENIVIDKA